jgi:hypothetical protein
MPRALPHPCSLICLLCWTVGRKISYFVELRQDLLGPFKRTKRRKFQLPHSASVISSVSLAWRRMVRKGKKIKRQKTGPQEDWSTRNTPLLPTNPADLEWLRKWPEYLVLVRARVVEETVDLMIFIQLNLLKTTSNRSLLSTKRTFGVIACGQSICMHMNGDSSA